MDNYQYRVKPRSEMLSVSSRKESDWPCSRRGGFRWGWHLQQSQVCCTDWQPTTTMSTARPSEHYRLNDEDQRDLPTNTGDIRAGTIDDVNRTLPSQIGSFLNKNKKIISHFCQQRSKISVGTQKNIRKTVRQPTSDAFDRAQGMWS